MGYIETGLYTIRSKLDSVDLVCRTIPEDKSLLPKTVYGHPKGFHLNIFHWEIRNLEGGRYILSQLGNHTGVVEDKVFAFLLPNHPPEHWKLVPWPQAGANTYMITTADEEKGWVVSEEDNKAPINVRRLIVGPSEPPFSPPNQLFEIKPFFN